MGGPILIMLLVHSMNFQHQRKGNTELSLYEFGIYSSYLKRQFNQGVFFKSHRSLFIVKVVYKREGEGVALSRRLKNIQGISEQFSSGNRIK